MTEINQRLLNNLSTLLLVVVQVMKEWISLLRSLVFYTGYAVAVILLGIYAAILKLGRFRFETNYRLLIGFSQLVVWWARACCGIRYQVIGKENIPDKPCVIISNHQSVWETFFLNIIFHPASAVVKSELLSIPFFGFALKMVEPISIDRSQPASALKDLISVGAQRIDQGRWVFIFPEGTRVKKGETKKYSAGGAMLAAKAGASILPIAHNAGDCWPSGRFRKYPGEIKVMIGPPISVEGKTRAQLMHESESWIRSHSEQLASQD